MKIFGTAQNIALKRPHRTRAIAAAALATIVLIALAVMLRHQRDALTIQLGAVKNELASSKGEVRTLQAELSRLKIKLDTAATRTSICTSNLGTEQSKVAAFAKQAAACETIRTQLHLKG